MKWSTINHVIYAQFIQVRLKDIKNRQNVCSYYFFFAILSLIGQIIC